MSYGRLKIYSDAKEITAANVVDEVNKAYAVHTWQILNSKSAIPRGWRSFIFQFLLFCFHSYYFVSILTISFGDFMIESCGTVPRTEVRG